MTDEVRNATLRDRSLRPQRSVNRPARSQRAQARNAELFARALALTLPIHQHLGIISLWRLRVLHERQHHPDRLSNRGGRVWPRSLSALAILFFVVGSFAGTLLVEFAGRYARRVLYCGVAAALAAITGLTQLGTLSGALAIAAISVAMGVMNNALSRVGAQAVSLTFVTGSLSRVGSNSRACPEARAPSRRAGPVGHPSAPRAAPGSTSGSASWAARAAVGRGHAAVWRVGASGSGPDPRRPGGGVRSSGPWRCSLSAYSAATAVTGT